jgi:putative Mg2+ transporter-C (MgtC) family protein
MNMPLSPTWTDIAIRLALTMLAGAIIGLNRRALPKEHLPEPLVER